MKKLFCMIALAAVTFGSVCVASPARSTKTAMATDTSMTKKKMKMKHGKSKMKVKRDTTMM